MIANVAGGYLEIRSIAVSGQLCARPKVGRAQRAGLLPETQILRLCLHSVEGSPSRCAGLIVMRRGRDCGRHTPVARPSSRWRHVQQRLVTLDKSGGSQCEVGRMPARASANRRVTSEWTRSEVASPRRAFQMPRAKRPVGPGSAHMDEIVEAGARKARQGCLLAESHAGRLAYRGSGVADPVRDAKEGKDRFVSVRGTFVETIIGRLEITDDALAAVLALAGLAEDAVESTIDPGSATLALRMLLAATTSPSRADGSCRRAVVSARLPTSKQCGRSVGCRMPSRPRALPCSTR